MHLSHTDDRICEGMARPALAVCLTLLLMSLAACAPAGNVPVTTEGIALTPGPTDTAPPPTVVTAETTPEAQALSIWLPEAFAPVNNKQAALLMGDQVNTFQAAQGDVMVETRLKKLHDIGGIVNTLQSASAVAPKSLPALTLVRREDLPTLVQAGLVQPLDGRISRAILSDFYPAALALGQLNGRLYGLPYTLDVQHMVYHAPETKLAQFSDVLASDRHLIFPAGSQNGISDAFLLQYLSAGGTLTGGRLGPVDANALRTTLRFYQDAVNKGTIDPTVTNYTRPEDYLPTLLDGQSNAVMVTSSMYLDLIAKGGNYLVAPVPAESDQSSTVLNGWMWVMIAAEADRQALALRFLDWTFNANRQSQYTQAIHMLPSLRATMRQRDGGSYTSFVETLLSNAILPLADSGSDATARAMQNALAAVISGQRTADQAAQDVVDQTSN
jgi:ABC-type glycerol-3-phosphate transport system substrate-binding protein